MTDEVPGHRQGAGHHGQLWPGGVRHPPLLQVSKVELAAHASTQLEGVTGVGHETGGGTLEHRGGRLADHQGGEDLAVGDVVYSVEQLLVQGLGLGLG